MVDLRSSSSRVIPSKNAFITQPAMWYGSYSNRAGVVARTRGTRARTRRPPWLVEEEEEGGGRCEGCADACACACADACV